MVWQESQNRIYHRARAKFIPSVGGGLKLAQVQYFSDPKFTEGGWELVDKVESAEKRVRDKSDAISSAQNIERASRRAKINAFDAILCNHDLDTFCTFTYRPEQELDKASYEQCYDILRPWLSNRVQRRDLKYVIVPERHKSGDIHFHGIMNSSALRLERAHSPITGRALSRNGMPIYNLSDWTNGFTTAQIIGDGESDRTKVAKYIFKYMGKQLGSRIGGRYALIGGAINKPVYVYGDTIEELIGDETPTYERRVDVLDTLRYVEKSFI